MDTLMRYPVGWNNGKPMCKLPCLFVLFAAVLTAAADPAPLALWPGTPPGEKAALGPEKDTTKPTDGLIAGKPLIHLGPVSDPTMTLYRAPEGNTGATVVVFPGGGYTILAMDLEGTEVCQWLNSIGVNCALVKYRVPARAGLPRYGPPLQDAQRAVGIVRHRAAGWGLDARRIGVLGFSAGGHLVAALSTNFDTRTYDAVDDADKVSCRPDFTLLIYPAYLTSKSDHGPVLAPELNVTANTPPSFLIQAEDDSVGVENSLVYYAALRAARVPAEAHLFPIGGHGYGLRPTPKPITGWPRLAEPWLRSLGVLNTR
jgi:acetyl esterase/lipase